MTDFVAYQPGLPTCNGEVHPRIRRPLPEEAENFAVVLAARGDSIKSREPVAVRLMQQLPVLLVADLDGRLVGWSGAQPHPLQPESDPRWLVAGLTVLPELRRRGIAARLLRSVIEQVRCQAPAENIFSVINAQNLASIDLHIALGFQEIDRAATFAGIDFSGGGGVLLEYQQR